jgi:hypothetical protein
MRQLLLAIALAGCNSERLTTSNGAIARTSSAKADISAAAPVHSVTGSGYSKPGPGLEFSTTLAIHRDATGRVWGRVVTRIIDLSVFGPFTPGELIQEPVCMRVVGNTAYISMVTVKTYDPNVSKVGDKGVFWVRDGGNDGGDVAYGGPAFFWDPTDAICTSTPPQLPAVAVDKGNFIVQ